MDNDNKTMADEDNSKTMSVIGIVILGATIIAVALFLTFFIVGVIKTPNVDSMQLSATAVLSEGEKLRMQNEEESENKKGEVPVAYVLCMLFGLFSFVFVTNIYAASGRERMAKTIEKNHRILLFLLKTHEVMEEDLEKILEE